MTNGHVILGSPTITPKTGDHYVSFPTAIFFLPIQIPDLLELLGILSGEGLCIAQFKVSFSGVFISDYGAYSRAKV